MNVLTEVISRSLERPVFMVGDIDVPFDSYCPGKCRAEDVSFPATTLGAVVIESRANVTEVCEPYQSNVASIPTFMTSSCVSARLTEDYPFGARKESFPDHSKPLGMGMGYNPCLEFSRTRGRVVTALHGGSQCSTCV